LRQRNALPLGIERFPIRIEFFLVHSLSNRRLAFGNTLNDRRKNRKIFVRRLERIAAVIAFARGKMEEESGAAMRNAVHRRMNRKSPAFLPETLAFPAQSFL
ncbi:MAG: hypothetical protein WBE38_17740, partial [Terracidiphilus sp.]